VTVEITPVPPTPTVVALRASGLGDLLTALPALRAIRRARPAHHLAVATLPALAPILDLAGLDERVVVVPTFGLAPLSGVIRPDLAVNLHGRGPQSHRVLLATEPAQFVAFRHPDVPESDRCVLWDEDEHEVERWCRLVRDVGIPADPAELDIARPGGPVPTPVAGSTLIHPGAGAGARRWPLDRWAAVARSEIGDGRDVVITAGPDEEDLAYGLAQESGVAFDRVLVCSNDVRLLARVVASAGRVLCADTGVAHLATALGRPSVVLFGPTSPARWGPPPERTRHVVLWAGHESDPLAPDPAPGLLEIQAADVILAVHRLVAWGTHESPAADPGIRRA
jgi:ADP-heptose:LPS heptosyltransferase